MVELICGRGYIPDWNALSAVATAAAAIVALYYGLRGTLEKRRKDAADMAAAAAVTLTPIRALTETVPRSLQVINTLRGEVRREFGWEVLYCKEQCAHVIRNEEIGRRLPMAALQEAEALVFCCRIWVQEIERRTGHGANPKWSADKELFTLYGWGIQKHGAALHNLCADLMLKGAIAELGLWSRLLVAVGWFRWPEPPAPDKLPAVTEDRPKIQQG